jgi:putative ABC transport system permease protein
MNSLFNSSLSTFIVLGLFVLIGCGLVGWLLGVHQLFTGVGFAKLKRSVGLAAKSLWLHKLRSFLSVLGIIIGTGAVIALMALGEGSMQDALEDIKRQGATNVIVRSVKPPDDSISGNKTWVSTYGLVKKDIERFETFGDAIIRVVPIRVLPTEARYLDRFLVARVIGTVPEYADVHKFDMSRGRFLTETDDNERKNVCVLGSEAADRLFPFEDPIGHSVGMRGLFFTVVGVISERMPTGGSGGSQAAEEFNRDIYISLNSSVARFGEIISTRSSGARMNEKVQYSQVTMTVSDIDKVRPVGDAIKQILEEEHAGKRDWVVTVPLDRLEEAERAKDRFTKLMLGIAMISLLVGGIGIMNIMLATVTERTREIGIRRALGAKQKDIVVQFLVEAVVQTTVGGLCGVITGLSAVYIGPPLLFFITGEAYPAKVHVPSIFISLIFSVLVGVVFGLYPAWRASRLDPIEALRHD